MLSFVLKAGAAGLVTYVVFEGLKKFQVAEKVTAVADSLLTRVAASMEDPTP